MSQCLTQKEPVRYTNKLIKKTPIQNYREFYLQLTKNQLQANIIMNDKERSRTERWRLKVDSVGGWTAMSGKLFQVLITRLKKKIFGGISGAMRFQ